MAISKKTELKPDKYIAEPVSLSPMPGKAPITLNTKENSEKVIKKETTLRIKDINNKIKAEG
jgi:hypothetical protein